MAILPDTAEPHPRVTRHQYRNDDLLLPLLAGADTLPDYASQSAQNPLYDEIDHCPNSLDSYNGMGSWLNR